ncbi:MAG TPA: CoA transferase, partial [Candidatus Binataceae bacterium]|nr:CoA transferase [Candidatus Binataceae bacterium]
EVAGQAGNDHPTGIPMGTFPTSDGYINLAASGGRLWKSMCEVMGKPEWMEKPEWKTGGGRSKDRAALNATISEVTKTKSAAYWMETLEAAGVPCGPINRIDQMFADPQVKHLGLAAPVTHESRGATELVSSPLNLSDVPKDIRYAAPPAGAQTDEILHSVGFSDEEIASMRTKGVI